MKNGIIGKMAKNMKKQYILLTALLFAFTACSVEPVEVIPAGSKVVINAYNEGAADTRTTVIDGGTHLYWESGEQIKIFCNGNSGKLTSQNTTLADVARFEGTFPVAIGTTEGTIGGSNAIWALYPYRDDAQSDGASVTTTLEDKQTGRVGSFAKNTFITLGKSTNFDVAFYNVTSGLCFTLVNEGIRSITFESAGGEAIAGTFKAVFDGNLPVVQQITDGRSSVTLTAPDGGMFETGKTYYIVTLPQTLASGFKVTFKRASEYAERSTSNPIIFSRGVFRSIENIDDGVTFEWLMDSPVDMGLSVKWCTNNLGATSALDGGAFFAWGETATKTDFSWTTYAWGTGADALTKYTSTDNKITLALDDDAAYNALGEHWRLPTRSEINELLATRTNPNYSWTWNEDPAGWMVKYLVNGNRIFFPLPGGVTGTSPFSVGESGFYWSSTRDTDYPEKAGLLMLTSTDASATEGTRYIGRSIRPVYQDDIGVKAVEFGLSVKWAECNLGATDIEDFGDYYAWGETELKTTYNWTTYIWCMGYESTLTKYCNISNFGYMGYNDGKTQLDPEDDVVHSKFGGKWRMPSGDEILELADTRKDKAHYTWEWTTIGANYGWRVTYLVNGNSLFFPVAGSMSGSSLVNGNNVGYYWSSSLVSTSPNDVIYFYLGPGGIGTNTGYRFYGRSIRPVLEY